MRRPRSLAWSLFLASAVSVRALGPHELALLVNANSPRSLAVANHFAGLRSIPISNIILLDLPDSVLEPAARITPADFTRCIWKPALRAINERGLEGQILAWVYSVDFPVALACSPEVSLQGITLLRNRGLDAAAINQGLYVSPFFAGPEKPNVPAPQGQTLDAFQRALGRDMPIPSMMLGFMGSRGNEFDRVLDCLRNGVRSNWQRPTGHVAFVVSQDVRSRCRHWQYPAAARDLARRGIIARITDDPNQVPPSLVGALMGTPWAPGLPALFEPGAMAEHLTSAAAYFHHYDQTKLSHWINCGATASAGTVCEPAAIWSKFPAACFYAHYADGCTMLESFFLSIRCPLQILLVGEPLASPWQLPGRVLLGLPDHDEENEKVSFSLALEGWSKAFRYVVLLNDRQVDIPVEKSRVVVNTRDIPDGRHVLRVVALSPAPCSLQIFGETEFTLHRKGRFAALRGVEAGATLPLHRLVSLRVEAEGEPRETGIMAGGRWLAKGAPGDRLAVNPAEAGEGPVSLRPAAVYADGETVRGEAVRVTVAADRTPPAVKEPTVGKTGDGWVWSPAGESGPDPLRYTWLQPVTWANGGEGLFGSLAGPRDRLIVRGGEVTLETTNAYDAAVFSAPGNPAITEFEAEVKSSVARSGLWQSQIAGLVFNYRSPRHFDFWGLMGDSSAWTFGRVRGGHIERAVERGAFIRPEQWHRLAVRRTAQGLEGYLNDDLVARWGKADLNPKAPLGFIAGAETAQFRNIAVSPPCAPEKTFLLENDSLIVLQPGSDRQPAVTLKADNGSGRTRKTVVLSAPQEGSGAGGRQAHP